MGNLNNRMVPDIRKLIYVRLGYLDKKILFKALGIDFILLKEHMNYAAFKGYLSTMKWLLENGCPWNEVTFDEAASHGNLDNMKWLLENRCQWTSWTFVNAAKHGNLENMKWLLANGCPWDKWTFNYAILYGNQKNIRWLKANLVY